MRWWKLFLIILLGAVILFGVLVTRACFEACEELTEQHELAVLEHKMTSEYGTAVVIGKAKNTSDVSLGWVHAKVKWYDSGGVVLDTSSDSLIDSLDPGEVWSFEVKGYGVDAEKVASYKIEVYGTK